MSLTRIYCPNILRIATAVVLPQSASHHVAQVLRHRIGEKISVFNAEQGEFLAEIVSIQRKDVTVQILNEIANHAESTLKIHLGQAISRNERMDFAIQKAVELGVASITPVITARCNIKLRAMDIDKRVAHWQKIVINACEQCGRSTVPAVNAPREWSTWMSQTSGTGVVCSPQAAKHHWTAEAAITETKVLIGPEGGLTDEEFNWATDHFHCIAMSLGPRVLRTETATVVALTMLQYHWGDIS